MAIKHTVVNVQTEEISVLEVAGAITPPSEGQSAREAGVMSKALAQSRLAQETEAKVAAKAGLSAAIELIVSTLESITPGGNEMEGQIQELDEESEDAEPSAIRSALLTLFVSSNVLNVAQAEAMGWSAPAPEAE
jgi:hypothetical protein